MVGSGVAKLFAEVAAKRGEFLLRATLSVGDETVAVLGPNGAGKTTLLQVLAGLSPPHAGSIRLGEQVLDDVGAGVHVPAEERRAGLVFQDYLLFPHLSAVENVAFGLRCRGVKAADARLRGAEWLARLGLSEIAGRLPARLSGGQAQRVALARALAFEPSMLLLDEPLAALDVTARAGVRRDLRRHLAAFAGPRLLVTHDPLEAATLADRVVVLEAGEVVQEGTIGEITSRPRSAYAADLAGVNFFRGRAAQGVVSVAGGGEIVAAEALEGEVFVVFHPHAVALHRRHPEGSPRNVWQGRISGFERLGERIRVTVEATPRLVAEVTASGMAALGLGDGEEVWASVKATEVSAYPA